MKDLDAQADHGAIIGYALATIHRTGTKADQFIAPPGTQIKLVFPKTGKRPEPGYDSFMVRGFFKSGMSEYDSTHVYVPLERLQEMRLLKDVQGRVAVNQIQVKVKPGVDIDQLVDRPPDRPGAAPADVLPRLDLGAEAGAAAGGGCGRAEHPEHAPVLHHRRGRVRHPGDLLDDRRREDPRHRRHEGARRARPPGVRGIFLGYGLLLGVVGSGIGMAGGLLFVHYINDIEKLLSRLTGRKVFDDSIYYFDKIPTLVDPWTVAWIVGGALFISAVACIWPAQRAATLHPVRALRFE